MEIDWMTRELKRVFDIKMLGRLSFALGIQFNWSDHGVTMTQTAYIDRIVKKFQMSKARVIGTPMQSGYKPQGVDDTSERGSYPY